MNKELLDFVKYAKLFCLSHKILNTEILNMFMSVLIYGISKSSAISINNR